VERIENIIDTLKVHFGTPERKNPKDPLSELIFTIFSQNTNDQNRDRAYARLLSRFPRWEDVMRADPSTVEDAIRVGGLGHQKSRCIQAILKELYAERGDLSLDFLDELSADEAKAKLLTYVGVGLKTASIVLLFSLGKPAFPVDTHIFRVGKRLGLIPENADERAAHGIMEELIPEDEYYSFHINLITLGRSLCRPRNPRCDQCPLARYCPFGETR
jgi:endonuclease-3